MSTCRHCGLSAAEHHEFEPAPPRPAIPAACVCEPGTWRGTVPPACDRFDPGVYRSATVYCLRCEHDEACHGR